jgi:hypothetical protein
MKWMDRIVDWFCARRREQVHYESPRIESEGNADEHLARIRQFDEQVSADLATLSDHERDARYLIRRRAAIRWPDDDPATGRHHQSDIHGGNAPGGAG